MFFYFLLSLFFSSSVLILYTWLLFPLVIYFISRIKKNKHSNDNYQEYYSVSIIVSAYNEESNIRKKIENLFQLDYPKNKLEIIVASDGSTDKTVSIVSEYKEVILLDYKENRGKASINNDAANHSSGEILFFTDSETILSKKFLKNALKYFHNKNFGCGSGDYTFESSEVFGESESFYWKNEKILREAEHELGILPFASGGCMLIRKELYKSIQPYSDIDNVLPLHTLALGKKVFYAKSAKASDKSVTSEKQHLYKRIRTTQRSFTDMINFIPILINKKLYIEVFIIFSHRFFRWSTGIFMFILFISNLLLLFYSQNFTQLLNYLLYLQLTFYFFGFIGFLQERLKTKIFILGKLFSLIYSFLIANFSFSIAIAKIISGYRIKSWK